MTIRVNLLQKIRGPAANDALHKERAMDETECTMSMSDESDEQAIFGGQSSQPKAEESIESAFVELQHEMREKVEQCDILRETLSNMSVNMKRQEFVMLEKDKEVEEKAKLLDEKTAECAEWKRKYEELSAQKLENAADTPVTGTKLPIVCPSRVPSSDPLLGTIRAVRPWTKLSVMKECLNEDEDEDSISDQYSNLDPLDTVFRSNRRDQRPYKPRKNRGDVKPFSTMPMQWIKESEETQEATNPAVVSESSATSVSDAEQEVEQVSTPQEEQQPHVEEEVSTPPVEQPSQVEEPVEQPSQQVEEPVTAPSVEQQKEVEEPVAEPQVDQVAVVATADVVCESAPDQDNSITPAAHALVGAMPMLDEIVMDDSSCSSSEEEDDFDDVMEPPSFTDIFLDRGDSDVSDYSDSEGMELDDLSYVDEASSKVSSVASEMSSLLPKRKPKNEMKKRRARIRRMARREARRTGFAIEKIEC